MNLLTDIPPQELLLPVEDARTVLKGWSERQIREKLIELYIFCHDNKTVIANCIYSEASDDIDIFFAACSELYLPIRKKGKESANNYLSRATNTEPKINNISVEEILAMLILKEAFGGDSKAAYKGAYHLSRLKLKRPKTLKKYLESAGTRKKVGAIKGGKNSAKESKYKSKFRHALMSVLIIDIAERHMPKDIVGIVADKIKNMIGMPKDKNTIRNIIHSHPDLKHISEQIRRK